jgi:T-complex protein 1 subunit zeta
MYVCVFLHFQAFADAILIVPKLISQNSGYDALETLVKLQQAQRNDGVLVGVDILTGEPCNPEDNGILDNVSVKRQVISSATVIANQLLLVDDVLAAGKPGAPKVSN